MLKPYHNPVTANFGLDRVPSEEALQVIEERSQQNTGSGIQENVIRGKPNDPYGFIPAPNYNQKVETRDMGVGTNEPVKKFDPEAESNGYDLDDDSQMTIPRNNQNLRTNESRNVNEAYNGITKKSRITSANFDIKSRVSYSNQLEEDRDLKKDFPETERHE